MSFYVYTRVPGVHVMYTMYFLNLWKSEEGKGSFELHLASSCEVSCRC